MPELCIQVSSIEESLKLRHRTFTSEGLKLSMTHHYGFVLRSPSIDQLINTALELLYMDDVEPIIYLVHRGNQLSIS